MFGKNENTSKLSAFELEDKRNVSNKSSDKKEVIARKNVSGDDLPEVKVTQKKQLQEFKLTKLKEVRSSEELDALGEYYYKEAEKFSMKRTWSEMLRHYINEQLGFVS
ncbi:MAG TPA: hypothetical protein VHE99_07160 [Gammaproteobacteria bacterium]|nr:hypothetical protein [Gammaproteobacteria bacterium]